MHASRDLEVDSEHIFSAAVVAVVVVAVVDEIAEMWCDRSQPSRRAILRTLYITIDCMWIEQFQQHRRCGY